ncbi:slit homolog 2 protein [Aplysia californica]|uniref:Slit homolog 2 protein n=1 Tax=Aplysia californica TaxID=6500 RepID=A0ABM0ZZP4_APLCA|nr:slit homolog 2 protein [Aplysia californica]
MTTAKGYNRVHSASSCGIMSLWFSLVFLFLVLPGVYSAYERCPRECNCRSRGFVDCSFRNLNYVPRGIPKYVQRLDLQGNNLTVIRRSDFVGFGNLRILQLLDNQIHTVEKGAFQDLTSMIRLRLDRNQLRSLPDLLFASMTKLERLDLSYNSIQFVGRKTLKSSTLLKNLQLDHNQITCLSDGAIRHLKNMEILTLSNNNMTSLPANLFDNMRALRVLRINDNKMVCDCHLAWLARWLRKNPTLALFTECHQPMHLRNAEIAELQEIDFKCDATFQNRHSLECMEENLCPRQCRCMDGVVDCRDKGFTKIPDNIPESAIEIRLEENHITQLPSRAFADLSNLKRIDLGKNQISYIAPDAFSGLYSLNSLVLYGNKIKDLPPGVFTGLSSLQLLLLNANKINCVRVDVFKDLENLNLLSLYDNNIQSLANGTFDPLANIQTIHLARNPLICDCNLKWLAHYLEKYPVETSGVRCLTPRRVRKKKISLLRPEKFRCKGSEEFRTKNAGNCMIDRECPTDCVCTGTSVDCFQRGLEDIPAELPMYTTELKLGNNKIKRLPADGLFKRLPNLQVLDLSENEIHEIEDGAFEAADKLTDLQLSNNELSQLSGKAFQGLLNVKTVMLRGNKITCINNVTFTETPRLRLLSLYDNQIRCVMKSSFERLHYLSTLNLMANPFTCNCHLGWLAEWLKKRNVITGTPTCTAPHDVKNTPIQDLKPKDFVCEENNELGCHVGIQPCCPDSNMVTVENSCDPRAYCPPKCTCTGTVVRCSHQQLNEIPKYIPLDTTELYVDVNDIAKVPYEIGLLTNLKRLDLSHNKIVTLPSKIFSNLTQLSTLILSYNDLQCISETSFFNMKNLRILSLHENNISTIPYGAFDSLKALSHIALGGNPLFCDCKLKWLSDWIKKDFIEPGIASCNGPTKMKSKFLLSSPSSYFECLGDPDPTVAQKCDVCLLNPCKNGGSCNTVEFKDFKCECTPGFHGDVCDQQIDACFGNPCNNGGKCEVMEHGRFRCECLKGFEGDRCETNIDDCESNMCQNNATCVDEIESYSCKCQEGYTGKWCENSIPYCKAGYNYCTNGATCVAKTAGYSCECPPGFTGKNCSENVDDCKSHACLNGASCVDGLDSYSCMCSPGYSGRFCEIAPVLDIVMLPNSHARAAACRLHQCQNNAVCYQPAGSPDYMCKCAPGFEGKKCEKLSSVSFKDKDSYVKLPRVDFRQMTNISISFTTKSHNGILLYAGEQQHIAVELFRGRIRVSFDVGNYPVSTMFSYERVDDGKPHVVSMVIQQKNFTMTIDSNNLPRTIVNEGSRTHLDLHDALYLGGLPSAINAQAFKKWHIRDGTSFRGCFSKVHINSKQVDLLTSNERFKVTPGCDSVNKDPCHNHLCQKGRCKPRRRKSGYRCKCKRGYSGTYCDRAPTCKTVVFRDNFIDPTTKCKSKARIRFRRCEGKCHNGYCCNPKRIKNRKVRLFCADRTSYIYELPIIRKCTCKKCDKK